MNYSVDLRQRVINWVLDGHTRKNASEVFEVHYQTVKTWVSRFLKTGECAPQQVWRSKAYKLDLEALRQDVQSQPDSFQNERACRFGVVQSTISKARSKLGLTRKNKTTCYLEQDEEQKLAFQMALQSLPDETVLVYLDECGIPQSLDRESGWAPKGDKVLDKRTGQRERKLNLVAGYADAELKAPFLSEGVMNTALFNTYLTDFCLPILTPGQIVIMDNVSFQKSAETKRLIENRGCQWWFLPPYSPELNPIEHLWAVFKRYVKRFQPHFNFLTKTIDFLFQTVPIFKGATGRITHSE